jgi:myosin heavy subunit
MVIAFVAMSDNYKEMYDVEQGLRTATLAEAANVKNQADEQLKKSAELKAQLESEIQRLEIENNSLEADKQKFERLAQQYQNQADSWKGVMAGFEQSVRNLQGSLEQTQQQLDTSRAQSIEDRKNLNQITADLYEKIIQMQDLEAERRRLLEQKVALEEQLTSGASASAMRPIQAAPVTPRPQTASPAPMVTSADIKGLVTAVGETMVQLSVGSADGVKPNMVFHISRGDRFLCDVVVTDVDINKCAGVLELVQQGPQIGDTASTQL